MNDGIKNYYDCCVGRNEFLHAQLEVNIWNKEDFYGKFYRDYYEELGKFNKEMR